MGVTQVVDTHFVARGPVLHGTEASQSLAAS